MYCACFGRRHHCLTFHLQTTACIITAYPTEFLCWQHAVGRPEDHADVAMVQMVFLRPTADTADGSRHMSVRLTVAPEFFISNT